MSATDELGEGLTIPGGSLPRLLPVAAFDAIDAMHVLDVRTPAEFETGHIGGAVNLPLADLTSRAAEVARADRPLVIICQSGTRAERAAALLREHGREDVAVLQGGMSAWSAAGRPAIRGRQRWAMERQVRLVAGSIVLTSVLASVKLARARYVAGAIGAGLTFSAVTNTCTMARVLERLPYNRAGARNPEAVVAHLTVSSRA